VDHALRTEVVVPGRDPRVHDRDADAGAVDAEVLAGPRRADGRAGTLERAVHGPVEPHRRDAGAAGQIVERRVGDFRDLSAKEPQAPARAAAKRSNEAVGGRSVGGLDDDP
jgi:hypothetical protein